MTDISLEQISLLAQIVSAIAVVASLIFVAFQLRQATRAMRNSSSQAHSATYAMIISAIIENAEFAAVWRRGLSEPDSLTPDEWVRFIACTSAQFRLFEASRVQRLYGQLDDEHWQNIEAQVRSFRTQPGILEWWKIRRDWHSTSFREWFEALPAGDSGVLYDPTESTKTVA